ncbi:transporter substrate-binding domain-containing protein [Sediminicoccus sp. KRV36]|uniref:transporter substrate-binding domain-containing protein n=1 Tax=Sediminicoccus sp. KRV36 TaxID=3133721 RepID=UPI00200F5B1C|nr:transporter substrate-binding domain-containing protein [Sediminicoccus rosea]UPY37698.1 transporter substrate-binding domain-containing protein [Sediminicoccus rosea]
MRRLIASLGLAALLITPAVAQPAPQANQAQGAQAQGGQNRQQARAAPARTLDAVRRRGHLLCGVNGSLVGFSAPDPAGQMRGLDADFCRAVAAAVFGDAEKVRFLPQLTVEGGLDALTARQIDVLARNATVTLSRDGSRPVIPTAVLFYDGMGFLVPRSLNVTSARQLRDKTVCWAGAAGPGTAGDALTAYGERHGLGLTIRRYEQPAQVVAAMEAGECHAFAADSGALVARRVTEFRVPENWLVLADIVSREPLSPFVRADDEDWRALVFWVMHVLTGAEYLGVSSANLIENLGNPDPRIRQMLAVEPGFGRTLRLPDNWAARVISTVGNYGEIFERNLGRQSVIGMDRGLNDQWTRGGLIYSFPTR